MSARARLLPFTVVAVMAMVAGVSFRPVFDGWAFLVAPLLGAGAATAVALAARRHSWLLGETALASALAYLVVGTLLVGIAVQPFALNGFVRAVADGWVAVLDVHLPASSLGEFLALPFTAAFAGAFIGLQLVQRPRLARFAPVGPFLTLIVSILFSFEERSLVLFQGAVLGVLFLVLAYSLEVSRPDIPSDATPLRVVVGVLTLAAAAAIGPVVAPLVAPSPPMGRIELRQYRPTPWDPFSVPSPLSDVKAAFSETMRDRLAFTVEGPAFDRIAVATLANYDGRVWLVADATSDAAAQFRTGDGGIDATAEPGGELVERMVTIGELGSTWVPVPPGATRVDFVGADVDLRVNPSTGTVALPGGLKEGLAYSVTSRERPLPTDGELLAAGFSGGEIKAPELLPEVITNIAGDIIEAQDLGWAQVHALQERFRETGFYSETRPAPGHSYDRLLTFLGGDQLEGYTEQYAAAAGVLARSVGIPARVVVGYMPDPELRRSGDVTEVMMGDIAAWIEVEMRGYGWIPVDVTPPKTQVLEETSADVETRVVAVVDPPPTPTSSTTTTTLALVGEDDEEEEDPEGDELEELATGETPVAGGGSVLLAAAAVTAGGSVIAVYVVAGLMLLSKGLVRRRRLRAADPALRVFGAWREMLDRSREMGAPIDTGETPRAISRAVGSTIEDPVAQRALAELAGAVDRAAYHPEPPSAEDAAAAWQVADSITAVGRARFGPFQRLKMTLNPVTVLPGRLRRERKRIAKGGLDP